MKKVDFAPAITGLTAIINKIEAARNEYAKKCDEIDRDSSRSGDWKLWQKNEALEACAAKLAGCNENADKYAETLEAAAREIQGAFDYSNPKLLSAATFINSSAGKLPDSAWQQMIEDFKSRPTELRYLKAMFESAGIVEAPLVAEEAAKLAEVNAALPRTLSEAVYYAVATSGSLDCASLRNEVQIYGEKLTASQAAVISE